MIVKPKAELIRYTPNPEETIALSAKLCYSESSPSDLMDKLADSDVSKFIKMLSNMGHLSTFEHASFSFAITGVSRALLAQITRHRVASFSVRSQRYVSMDDFNYLIPPSIVELGEDAVKEYQTQMDTCAKWYKGWQEKLGGKCESANEDARFVLPNACETNMILTMNARELIHFFELRCCNRAQWEIRDIAWQMLEAVIGVAPNVFSSAGAGCCSGPCPEGAKCCTKAKQVKEKQQAMVQKALASKSQQK